MCCAIIKVMIIIAVLGAVVLVIGAVLGFAVFNNIVDDRLIESVRLEPGTEQFERWENLPMPLTFKVYIFNVTNVDEIMEGEKPNVQEVGPYIYRQHRRKQNVDFNSTLDTLTYEQYLLFEFDTVASFPLRETDVLTVLNVPLQGVFQLTEISNPKTVNSVYRTAFPDADTPFHQIAVRTFLFGGYQFCDPEAIAAPHLVVVRQFCNTLRSQLSASKTLTVDENNVINFSFFKHKNNNHDGTYVINAGNEDIHQVGAIQSWNGKDRITPWNDNENSTCNVVRGRDSSIYPPFNNDSSEFDIFNTDICRIVQLKTTSSATFKGIDGNVATLDIDNFSNMGDRSCYCTKFTKNLDGENECLPEGFADLGTCVGAPVVASFPHLLGVDRCYQSTVDGLLPDEDKHNTFVNIEPGTGIPLQGAKRMQFNMFIRPIEDITATEKFPRAVMPILWVEEGIELSDDLVQQLKNEYLNMLVALDAVTWTLIGVGIAVFVVPVAYILFVKLC